jgi:hypothetical protein
LAITAIHAPVRSAASGAVAQAHHGQRIGKPRDAQPDPPLGRASRACASSGKRLASTTLSIIRIAVATRSASSASSRSRALGERLRHQPREVDRPQQAGAVGRQGCSPQGFVAAMVSA